MSYLTLLILNGYRSKRLLKLYTFILILLFCSNTSMLLNYTGNFMPFQFNLSISAFNRFITRKLFSSFLQKCLATQYWKHLLSLFWTLIKLYFEFLYFSGKGIYENPLIGVYLTILICKSNRRDIIQPLP